MDRATILQLFKQVVETTGFKVNRDVKYIKSWMARLGPNDYRSVTKHGTYRGKKAVLKVSPHENLTQIRANYERYQKMAEGKAPVLEVPTILSSGRIPGVYWLIQESAPKGVRILDKYPFSTPEQKREVARLYWNTVANFPAFEFGEWSISDYFLERIDKWFTAGRENGAVRQGFITQREKDDAVRWIFANLPFLRIEPFFAHFGNTDIVKAYGRYFIWDASIVPKPEAAGIALWLWNLCIYASYQKSAKWLISELADWENAFMDEALGNRWGRLGITIKINFLERLLGTLLVDLPLGRGPFFHLDKQGLEKATRVIRFVFKDTL